MAEELLAGRSPLTWDPTTRLARVPGKDGFTLESAPGTEAGSLGNVTGIGPSPAPGGRTAGEMAVAVALTPLFRSMIDRDPDTPWVYYTSLDNFMYLYPRVGTEEFMLAPEIYDLEFIRAAGPAANPTRSVFWTSVYEDAAGKGPMVTISAPVYQGSIFRGAVSADITIKPLDWLLRLHTVPHSTVQVLGGDGKELLGTGGTVPPFDPNLQASGVVTAIGKDWVTEFPLKFAPWRLVVVTDAGAARREAVAEALPVFLITLAFSGIVILILALVRTLRKVDELSTTDALTGLLNRRMFDRRCEEEFARRRRQGDRLGLALFDLDDFKNLNDSRGHQEGDRALKAVAACVRGQLERATDFVFRIGGEEFAILLPIDDDDRFAGLLADLVASVAALDIPHPLGSLGKLTISMGAVVIAGTEAEEAIDDDEAYRRADAALYLAKSRGKNRAFLDRGEGRETGPSR